MKVINTVAIGLVWAMLSQTLQAHEFMGDKLHIDHPWARPTPPVEPINSAVYLVVKNHGEEDRRLIRATTPLTDRVSIHRSEMVDGMMSMKAMPNGVTIKPGETARFEPSGLHIMLMNLNQPLKEGEHFPLSLTFDDGQVVELQVNIEFGAEEAMEHHNHGSHDHGSHGNGSHSH